VFNIIFLLSIMWSRKMKDAWPQNFTEHRQPVSEFNYQNIKPEGTKIKRQSTGGSRLPEGGEAAGRSVVIPSRQVA
jgi:hypothetical protein